MHRGGTPQSTLQALSVPTCVRKKALNPRRKIECTHARMMGKSDIQFGIWFLTCLKRCCVDICCLQEMKWKVQGAKMIGNVFKLLWSRGCKAENCVGVIVAN